jgi:hypothetical protein
LSRSKNRGAENGVRDVTLWRALLGVENVVVEDVVVEDVELDDEMGVVVAHVRPRRAGRGRCGVWVTCCLE